ncbi:MAG TPA: tRNA (adenosine(37)-N6)-threonylcarbamoyltransferase complex transferase subunit TsaD [Tepidisphaeraceae bacterium]|jgi:N6-L-threonylcarbamoyladenine synthase|nr:tRNA (adenosine(37)-N6)-threonylcarbamoyltransferase complex transferase subunit TsaD [Tepidisphaeraceae bacterium]
MPLILGIESTCDETAAAVVADGARVLSNVVATQVELHARYRGVVPEIASRAHIENILPVVQDALAAANCGLAEVDAVAVAHRPGLVGSLLVGVTAAKTLAWAAGKPLIAIDHVHAHLYSVLLDQAVDVRFPAVGLVCSGGHTALYAIDSWREVRLIGATIDDAVGEAYDKVAATLGLAYPGGPILDRLAAAGDPKRFQFPRTTLGRDSLDFSFSGIKTALLYHVRGVPGKPPRTSPPDEQEIDDIAAGFQAACVAVLTEKIRRAARQVGARSIVVGGGVSANAGLRAALARFPLPVFFPLLKYCTDNAAMSAGLAAVAHQHGDAAGLDLDAVTYSRFAR